MPMLLHQCSCIPTPETCCSAIDILAIVILHIIYQRTFAAHSPPRLLCRARSALKRGVAGLSFEINDNKIMEDALTLQGLITQFVFALRLQEHYQSLAHWGTVCSSWIWMSRSSTGRAIFQPLGDRWSDSARAGNIMVSRMTLVLYLLVAKRRLLRLCSFTRGLHNSDVGPATSKLRRPWQNLEATHQNPPH